MTFLVLRRHQVGPRRHDRTLAVLLAPWHVLSSAVVTALCLVVPAFLGLVSAVATALALATRWDLASGEMVGVPAAVLVGATAWASWWGLGGSSLRRGTRTMARRGTSLPGPRWAVTVALVAVGVLGAAWCAGLHGAVATWAPLPDLPFGRWVGWRP